MSDLPATVAALRLGQQFTFTQWGTTRVRGKGGGLVVYLSRDEFTTLMNEWDVDTSTVTNAPLVVSAALVKSLFANVELTTREKEVLAWVRSYRTCHRIDGAERLVRLGVLKKTGKRAHTLTRIGKLLKS